MKIKHILWNWITRNLLLAAGIIAVLAAGAHFSLKILTKHNQELSVPDFSGLTVQEANTVAHAHGIRVQVKDSVYIKRMERGTVFSQRPAPGSRVKQGRNISVTINAVNPKKITMPNLVGYSMRQAKAELSSRGLSLGRLIYIEDLATNNVLHQLYEGSDIKAGSPVESESSIDLVVGLNGLDNQTYIPALYGMKYLNAVDAVHNSSLNIQKLVFDRTVKDYTDSVNAFVYRQVPDTSSVSFTMGTEMTLYLTLDRNRIPVSSDK